MLHGNESYDLISKGFAPVLKEINELIEYKVIEVNDEIMELNVIFGGDYKVCYMYMYT